MSSRIMAAAAVAAALLIQGCDRQPGNNANIDETAEGNFQVPRPANAAAPLPPAAPTPAGLDGARALIDRIYTPYTRGQLMDAGGIFTPEMEAAIQAASAEEAGLGADPFCQCQDFENLTYSIAALEPAPDGAVARVAVRNLGESYVVPLGLVRRGEEWRVADVGEGEASLSRMLAAP